MNTQQNKSGGIGFAGLLTILFITLKLTGSIPWSWIWVLCPLWIPLCIPLAVDAAIVIIIGIGALLACIVKKFSK